MLSQVEIASAMNNTPALLNSIENGDPSLDCEALTQLSQRYPSINLNWFIKGQGYPLRSEKGMNN